MEECSDVLARKLDGYNGKEVDVFPICNMFALDVVCGKKIFFINLKITRPITFIFRMCNGKKIKLTTERLSLCTCRKGVNEKIF